jgi:hypothetical protein
MGILPTKSRMKKKWNKLTYSEFFIKIFGKDKINHNKIIKSTKNKLFIVTSSVK